MTKRWGRMLLAGLPALFVLGCPGTPNPAAELAGAWRLIFDTPGDLEGFDIVLTFDANGQLTRIDAESPQGGEASLTLQSATTTVEGDQVTIGVPTNAGARTFDGTLSANGDTIEGEFSQTIDLPSGDLDVTLPDTRATLHRITSCGDNDDCDDGEICQGGECVEDDSCATAADCNDNDACTTDTCTQGDCGNAAIACQAVGTCPAGCNVACTNGACSD